MIEIVRTGLEYEVRGTSNNKLLGKFIQEVDGFFYFFPEKCHGFWTEYALLEIGKKLKAINRPWVDKLELELRLHLENGNIF